MRNKETVRGKDRDGEKAKEAQNVEEMREGQENKAKQVLVELSTGTTKDGQLVAVPS